MAIIATMVCVCYCRELERVKEQVEELQKCQLKVSGQREQDTLAVEGLTII